MTTRTSLRDNGEAMRRRLFGDDDGAPAFMRTLNREAVYGAIWSRPGLALEDRMVCALAALGAVQRLKKLRRHVAAALDLGLSPRAIVEILIQIGIYAGFAASEEAVEAAGTVFAEQRRRHAGGDRAGRPSRGAERAWQQADGAAARRAGDTRLCRTR